MNNTRQGMKKHKKLFAVMAGAIMMITLFCIVFAGTLSGAFAIDNITDIASAAQKTAPGAIDMSSLFDRTKTTGYSLALTNDQVSSKRGKWCRTNADNCGGNAGWSTFSSWEMGGGGTHTNDYAICWFEYDLGEFSKYSDSYSVTFTGTRGTYTASKTQGWYIAIEAGDSACYFDSDSLVCDGTTYKYPNNLYDHIASLSAKCNVRDNTSVSVTLSNITKRYVRVYMCLYDNSWDFNEVTITGVTLTLTRDYKSYDVAYDVNGGNRNSVPTNETFHYVKSGEKLTDKIPTLADSYFTGWKNGSNVFQPSASTSTTTFANIAKSAIDAGTSVSLTAQYSYIPFTFNNVNYTQWDSNLKLQVLQGKTGYLSSSISSSYPTSITYSSGSQPTTVGTYTATITVKDGTNATRGSVTITFEVVEGDFAKLGSGTGVWGSSTNPYVINTAQHLYNLSAIVRGDQSPLNSVNGINDGSGVQANNIKYEGAYFVVTRDINMSTDDWKTIFRPIGYIYNNKQYMFSGHFDGGNYTITIAINQTESFAGLFGWATGGSISNLTVAGSVKGGSQTGGLCGGIYGETINNVTVNMTSIAGTDRVGGIAGRSVNATLNGTIAISSGSITGTQNVGGLFGTCEQEGVGSTISLCNNIRMNCPTITGTANVGGYIGWLNVGDVMSNISIGTGYTFNGNITGTEYRVGGIIGYVQKGSSDTGAPFTISGCTVSGMVKGKAIVGGIVGHNDCATISGCTSTANVYSTGVVTSKGLVIGGIAGYSGGEIKNCYTSGVLGPVNSSNVISEYGWTNYVGGIVGETVNKVSYCYTQMQVNGSSAVGGIVGSSSSTIDHCYFNGKMTSLWNDVGANVSMIAGSGTVTNSWIMNNITSSIPSNVTVKANYPTLVTSLQVAPVVINGSNVDVCDWESIVSKDINGFQVSASVNSNNYLLSKTSDGTQITPTSIYGDSDFIGANIDKTFVYSAGILAGKSTVNTLTLNVAIKGITLNNINKTYDAKTRKGELNTSNVTLAEIGTGSVYGIQFSYPDSTNYIDAGTYNAKLVVKIGDQIVGGIDNFNIVISKREIYITNTWKGTANPTTEVDGKVATISNTYIYDGIQHGLSNVICYRLIDKGSSGYPVLVEFGYQDGLYQVLTWTNFEKRVGTNQGTYETTLTLVDTTNYILRLDSLTGSEVDSVTYKLTINPATLTIGNFYYNGEVSNNTQIAEGKYPLQHTLATHDGKPALVYQGGGFGFGAFHITGVNGEVLTLVSSGTSASHKSYNFKAKYSIKSGNSWATLRDLADINSIMLTNLSQDPYEIHLVFESLDNNYTLASDCEVYFTLLNSDFGIIDGGTRDNTWGSATNPYVLSNVAHFIRLSDIVNGSGTQWDSITVGQANSITYSGSYFVVSKDVTLSNSMGFNPIGKDNTYHFAGNISGVVSNSDLSNYQARKITLTLTYDDSFSQPYIGLFGLVAGGSIHHLTNTSAITNAKSWSVGGLAGQLSSANIYDVAVTGSTVQGGGNVGGVAGQVIGSTLNNVTFNGSVSGATNVGGITGRMAGGTIANPSVTTGSQITGTSRTGGIVGILEGGIITDVTFTGAITGADYVGGIVGSIGKINGSTMEAVISAVSVTNATSTITGNLNGRNWVGGIAGYAAAKDCVVTLDNVVSGKAGEYKINATGDHVGGLVGYANNINFVNIAKGCASIPINATGNYVGGLVGYWEVQAQSQINNGADFTYNTELSIKGGSYVGGLVGYMDVSAIAGFDYTPTILSKVNVAGGSYVGGLYGKIIGKGYKKTSSTYNNDNDSVINIDPSKIKLGTVSSTGGQVMGGVIGYAESICVKIADNITIGAIIDNFSPSASTDFVGALIGAVGYNATIEGIKQDGGTHNIVTVTNDKSFTARDNVGGIIGYISSTAGIYYATDWTVIGNYISLVNTSSISGDNNVGGIVGAVGGNLLGESASSNILTFCNIDDSMQGGSFIINKGNIAGKNNVGGIVGIVGSSEIGKDRSQLRLVNTPVDSNSYTNLFNDLKVYNSTGATDSNLVIQGSNAGGIAGYLGTRSHYMQYIVSEAKVGDLSASNVGGLVGCMNGGMLTNCVVYASTSTPLFIGLSNIGGLVGDLSQGNVANSVTIGVPFKNMADSIPSVGAVAGNVGQNASLSGAWGLMIAGGTGSTSKDITPNYTTTPANSNGNIILADDRIITMPDIIELAITTGICNATGYQSTGATHQLSAEAGYLSLAVKTKVITNSQLAFYDLSGGDVASDNIFKDITNVNDIIYFRLGATGDLEQDSMLICTKLVEFGAIKTYRNGNGDNDPENPANKNAAESYRAPGGSDSYVALVTGATYDTTYYNITSLNAVIHYGSASGPVIGECSLTFTIGGASSPYIISTQADWNAFAAKVRGGTSYAGQYVKLMLSEVVTVTASNLAGSLTDSQKGFQGTFDGNGYTINLNIVSNTQYISLFPHASGATFRNLTLAGKVNATTYSGDAVLSINNNTQHKENTHASANVAAFVANPQGSITFYNCTNNAWVAGFTNVAGFVSNVGSSSHTLNLTSCVNNGTIVSLDGSYARTGKNNTTYSYDDGWGNAYGYTNGTGGFVGKWDGTLNINSCLNTGNVTGGHNVGGIVGRHDVSTITVQDSANTGYILSNSGYFYSDEGPEGGNDSRGIRQNIWGYAGGLIGKTSQYSVLKLYTSYNAGTVTTLSNFAGGLVGCIGLFYQPSGKNRILTSGRSTVAYCYNIGTVNAGGTKAKKTAVWLSGREEYGGTIVGGIAGAAGDVYVTDCYNAGEINAFGNIGYSFTYQERMAGIIGQGQPEEDTTQSVIIENSYNIGDISAHLVDNSIFGIGAVENMRYGAPILGYCDKSAVANRLDAKNCYSIANSVVCYNKDGTLAVRQTWLDDAGAANGNLCKTGTTVNTYSEITALMNSGRSLATTSTVVKLTQSTATLTLSDANLRSTLPDGWLYVYGCLPQLAVFTLDTPNGLSMRSVGFGRDQYGEFNQTPTSAGSAEYPYIIRDGVDLMGLSALSMLGFTFEGDYIEFANGENIFNNDSMPDASKYILLPSTAPSSGSNYNGSNIFKASTDNTNWTIKGKSYHLFENGGLCNQAFSGSTLSDRKTIEEEYGAWVTNNYAYVISGETASWTKGKDISVNNLYPIGYKFTFNGSIGGAQAEGGNTTIVNMRVTISATSDTSIAGMFGKTLGATISNITTTGTITAHSTTQNVKAYAGGVVANAMGGTSIINCGTNAIIKAQSNKTKNTSAGGIVGIVSGNNNGDVLIDGCFVDISSSQVSITTPDWHIGGIVGYVGNENGSAFGRVVISNCDVRQANIKSYKDTTISANYTGKAVGYNVGGIVGASNENTTLTIKDVQVGTTNAKTVSVAGAYSIGGVIGSVRGGARITNAVVGANTALLCDMNDTYHDSAYNTGTGINDGFGASIGGIVGNVKSPSGVTALTISDYISFKGAITVDTTNYSANTEYVTRNIGGIVGLMCDTSFIYNGETRVYPTVVSAGTITVTGAGKRANIGGVAGFTQGASFIGSYAVAPSMSLGNANEVGGFIGENGGDTAILAYQQGVTSGGSQTLIIIGGTISGYTNVGGFIGLNTSNNNLYIAPDTYAGVQYGNNSVGITIIGSDMQNAEILVGDEVVDRVTLNKASISAVSDNIGGLVGYNNGNLIITKGNINIRSGATIQGNDNAGGIVGWNNGVLTTGGSGVAGATLTINNAGTIIGHDNVGGIIGKLSYGTIDGVFTNSGNVTGEINLNNGIYQDGGNYVGGIIGNFEQGTLSGEFTNTGSVSGHSWVGGSIGRMGNEANILVSNGTVAKFTNGVSTAGTSDEAMVAEDSPSGNGNVVATGMYAGGSIGSMIGRIEGTEAERALFINYGVVNAPNYTGGSIGVLNGYVNYTAFLNYSGDWTIDAQNSVASIGGSVGYVGNTFVNGRNYVVILNSHFENNGNVIVNGGTPDTTFMNGIGGIFGAIEGFKGNETKPIQGANEQNWNGNTFYVSGKVISSLNNVGGVIGVILEGATNLTISNMLSYNSEVKGNDNVGGIVGATFATGTVISNSFNVEGTVEGNRNVGGIIGCAYKEETGATNASTSYWVKGESNINLERLGVNNLNVQDVASLKYIMYQGQNMDTFSLLTSSLSSPAEYIDSEMTPTEKNSENSLDFEGENTQASVATSAKLITIRHGELEDNDKYYLALRRVYTITKHVVDDVENITHKISYQYQWRESAGANAVDANWKEFEYIEYIGEGAEGEHTACTWKTLLEKEGKFSNINVSTGYYYTESTTTATYTTGTAQTGWFFKYASAESTEGIGAITTLHNADVAINIEYWKFIAGAVTYRLTNTGHGISNANRNLGSLLRPNSAPIEKGHFYAVASKGMNGYYLYMATSTNAQPVIDGENGDGSYYINTTANGTEGNIAIFYKPINVRSSIKYNGYDRVTPISNPELNATAGYTYEYKYTDSTANKPRNAGEYEDDVKVHYTYNGTAYLMNDEYKPTWRITQKDITITTKSSNKIYGDSDNYADVTIDGIAPNDLSSGDQLTIKVTIGTAIYYVSKASHGSSETGTYYVKNVAGTDGWQAVSGTGLKVGGFTFMGGSSSTTKGLDKTFTANNQASSANAYKFTFRIQFTDVATYSLKYEILHSPAENAVGTNYNLSTKDASVNVKPRQLTIKISPTSTGKVYDGKAGGTLWQIEGWATDENIATTYNGTAYKDLLGIEIWHTEGSNGTTEAKFDKQEFAITDSYSQISTGAIFSEVGKYYLKLNGVESSGGQMRIGNYYFSIGDADGKLTSNKNTSAYTIGRLGVKVLSWSAGTYTYDNNVKTMSLTVGVYDMDSVGGASSNLSIDKYYEALNSNKVLSVTKTYSGSAPSSDITWKGTSELTSFDSAGKITFTTDRYAGSYKSELVWNGGDNNIYYDGENNSATLTINRKDITVSLATSASTFVYNTNSQGLSTMGISGLVNNEPDEFNISVSVKGPGNWSKSFSQKAENNNSINISSKVTTSDVGQYTASISTGNVSYNYYISNVASITWTITKKELTMTSSDATFVYNGSERTPSISLSTGNKYNKDTLSFDYTSSPSPIKDFGEYTITFGSLVVKRGSSAKGDNGVKLIDNYDIKGSTSSIKITITKAKVSLSSISATISKVYDATTNVESGDYSNAKFTWANKSGTGVVPTSGFSITGATYADANVGTGKAVTYTVSLSNSNFELEGGASSTTITMNHGEITPATLIVTLSKLRSGKATRTFDGTTAYGGAGFTGNANGNSAVYRSGEGFSVSGFKSGGTSVTITAKYQEVNRDRSQFDAYVNNVYKSGSEYYIGTAESNIYHKMLVFTISYGSDPQNYNFVVRVGSNNITTESTSTANVYDKDYNDSGSGVDIEITVKSIKATYNNTAQSYANADNTYNTNWLDVTGSAPNNTGLSIQVVNGWKKVYTQYTVIRGRVGSDILSASITKDIAGNYINYSLSNQPTLTIGYFINRTQFEIGSLASLIIASYYLGTSNDEFNKPIVSGNDWILIVSDDVYKEGTFTKPSGTPEDCTATTWDQYFEYIEGKEGVTVFLNTAEGSESGWGYYKATESTNITKYSSFLQVANISGVLTKQDIQILDSFFTIYEYGENGELINTTPQEWGVGKTYVNNFINVGSGNIIIAIDSIFPDKLGSGAEYDGGGYTINYFNIISTNGVGIGMFANVDGGSVKNVHLRNFNIVVSGTGTNANVGGIIAKASNTTLQNSTFHGSIQVNGVANVGGLIGDGSGRGAVDGAIILGNMDVNNAQCTVGGAIGNGGTISNVVSMMYIDAMVTDAMGTVSALGNSSTVSNSYYLASSVWVRTANTLTALTGGVSYDTLRAGSKTGYSSTPNYFVADVANARDNCGTYDMIDNVVKLEFEQDSKSKQPRESMRLCDMIDVYLLMYTLTPTRGTILAVENVGYFTKSATSWLVGNKTGTSSSMIVIANQQGVALLRELRFASFSLANDVEMYVTHSHRVFDGAFFGSVSANGHTIDLQGATRMFEAIATGSTIPIKQG